jgi:hypothetical protein
LNANSSFIASHSLFKNCSPHLSSPDNQRNVNGIHPFVVWWTFAPTPNSPHISAPSISKSPFWTTTFNFSHFYYNVLYNPLFATQLWLSKTKTGETFNLNIG